MKNQWEKMETERVICFKRYLENCQFSHQFWFIGAFCTFSMLASDFILEFVQFSSMFFQSACGQLNMQPSESYRVCVCVFVLKVCCKTTLNIQMYINRRAIYVIDAEIDLIIIFYDLIKRWKPEAAAVVYISIVNFSKNLEILYL